MGELTTFLKMVGEIGFPICLCVWVIWQGKKDRSEADEKADRDRKEYIALLTENDRKNIEFISTRVSSMREELLEARKEVKETRDEMQQVRADAKKDTERLREELKEERAVFKMAVESFVKTVDKLDQLTNEVDEIKHDVKILKELENRR